MVRLDENRSHRTPMCDCFRQPNQGAEVRRDNEYESCGTTNVFCAVERKAGRHPVINNLVIGHHSNRFASFMRISHWTILWTARHFH